MDRTIKSALLIANPASRSGRRRLPQARTAIEQASIRCDVAFTERPGHASEIALARAAEYDVVFTLGGDGTAMEVAGALAGSSRPLGVLAGAAGLAVDDG